MDVIDMSNNDIQGIESTSYTFVTNSDISKNMDEIKKISNIYIKNKIDYIRYNRKYNKATITWTGDVNTDDNNFSIMIEKIKYYSRSL